MNWGQLIQSVLASVGAIAVNPAFGIAGVAAKLVPLLSLISSLVSQGAAALEKLKALDEQIKAIVAEGRVPTDAEWAEWDARHQSAKARLQA
jgi:hypothetical protein